MLGLLIICVLVFAITFLLPSIILIILFVYNLLRTKEKFDQNFQIQNKNIVQNSKYKVLMRIILVLSFI